MAAKFSSLYLRFFFGIVLCIFSANLFAQNFHEPHGLESNGFDRKVFSYHFDRADRELDPASWMREARRGIDFVVASWERTALELYSDPVFAQEIRRDIIRWSEEELEKRYAQWLFNRFFGQDSGLAANVIDTIVDTANRLYVYHTDENGNILYGETGAPLGIRPSEGRSVEQDLVQWNIFVSAGIQSELQNYRTVLASALPELLFYISETNRPGFFDQLNQIVNLSLVNRKAEFEALLAREERLFIARRTGDIWSLRKLSENESAFAISSRLIYETEMNNAAALAALNERIEAAKAGTGDLVLAGEEWLRAFQEQFDRGLKLWSEAEERFIIRRMEWERDSGQHYMDGHEIWKDAFLQLEQARLNWEESARDLFYAGEQLFINASEQLNLAINEAREEFQRDAALRIYSGTERARALVDMFITSGSVLAEARNSVQFWLTRFVSGAPANALENGTLAAWVEETKLRVQLNINQQQAASELIRWANLYTQYQNKSREALSALEKEFGLALGMDGKALNDVLGTSSEDFFLDEYQIELLRAKAVAGYWEQRLAIAEAVSAYAEDLTAGRLTEIESLQQWREAKDSYDAALLAYAEIQQQLKASGQDLILVQQELQKAAALLTAEERNLNELNNRYSLQLAAYRTSSNDFILRELGNYYASLMELTESRQNNNSYYTAYLRAQQRYINEYLLSDSWTLFESIVRSDADNIVKDLQLALLSAVSGEDWYFSVTGQEKTIEAVMALNDEGLFNRLLRDAREGDEAASLRLSVYMDLFHFAPGIQQEAAVFALNSISRVFAEFGIYSDGTLPNIHSITEGLLHYSEENELSAAIVMATVRLRIDDEIGILPMALETEVYDWLETLSGYMAAMFAYNGYEIQENIEDVFIEYEIIVELALELMSLGINPEVYARDAAFNQYLINFLLAYNAYLTAGETSNGREHWRSYADTLVYGNGTLSWNEGLMADAYEQTQIAFRKVSEAFALFFNNALSARQVEFIAAAGDYLGNADKTWEYVPDDYELAIAMEIFREEMERLDSNSSQEEWFIQQIIVLGFEYTILPAAGEAALEEINYLSLELEKARTIHQNVMNQYNVIAAEFAKEGNRYESLYGKTKDLFAVLEETRQNYEKQDAIQRWASTSYLNNSSLLSDDLLYYREPQEELAYAQERYFRANIALAALQDMYKSQEKSRPYANEEYTLLYEEFQKSFSRMFLTLKAKTEFDFTFDTEHSRNQELYVSLLNTAFSFVSPDMPDYYNEYTPPSFENSTWLDFVYITGSGALGISYDKTTFKLTGITQDDAAKLSGYFTDKPLSDNGINTLSSFETAFAQWSLRMASYNMGNRNNYDTWGLALDYILRNLAENNHENKVIQSRYTLTQMGADGQIRLDGRTLDSRLNGYRNGTLKSIQQDAWNRLNAQQRQDLEFLAVLYLTGGSGNGAAGLEYVSQYREMAWLYNRAGSYIRRKGTWFGTITTYRWPYTFDQSELNQVRRTSSRRRDAFNNTIASNSRTFSSNIAAAAYIASEYNTSSEKITLLSLQKDDGIQWSDIETVLAALQFTKLEILSMELHWEEMYEYYVSLGENPVYNSVNLALDNLYIWGKGARDTIEQKFERAYLEDERLRLSYQQAYRQTLDAFINGDVSLEALNKAAELAYGPDAPALKNHLHNLGTTIILDLAGINADQAVYTKQYNDLADQYVTLIERSYAARLSAELGSRETAWNEQRKDLNTKLASWREASGLILERGRQDWKDGFESMEIAFERWENDFNNIYTEVDAAWNAAYLESLINKETWINQAVKAANEALDSNLIALIGSDAQSFSRKLDGFMPSAFPGFGGAEDAALAMQNVLGMAGITNLFSSISSLAGSAGTISTMVKSGVSGLETWNSGQIRAIAREFAVNSTNDLANGKMVLLAFQAREAALTAKNALEEKVVLSNRNIDGNMDEMFLMSGGWKRSYNNYVKNIVVHSTLFSKAITETAALKTYHWFVMEHWDFSTDLSDANLQNLDYLGVQEIIAMAQDEVKEKTHTIFGDDGLFVSWIGEAPRNMNNGSGELGRLISSFNNWEQKQAKGVAAMNAPLWDKPIWDSRNSWFDAPSIRTTFDIANSIASTAIMAMGNPLLAYAVNMSDDLLFYGLDVAYGYKTWDEAGLEFGKKALVSAISTFGGFHFGGLGDTVAAKLVEKTGKFGFTAVATKTAVSSATTFTVGTATSTLSAVTFDSDKGKFGWDNDVFKAGLKSSAVSAAVARTSTITSSLLNTGLDGFINDFYIDGTNLSSLVGGLAGQGLNFAMGGNFTINPTNLGFFNNSLQGTGLLEVNIGRNGITGSLGTGGLNLNYHDLSSAWRGLEAWKVNFEIWNSGSESAKEYIRAMRTLYSGDSINREAYESILANQTRIVQNREDDYTKTTYDEVTGIKTIALGNDALNDGSRFGLNVYISHESYRNGIDDGNYGQRQETNRAVTGHINTALGLMQTYGIGSIGEAMAVEAKNFSDNLKTLFSDNKTELEKMTAFIGITETLYSYDANVDFWRLQYDGTLVSDGSGWLRDENGLYINRDGSRTTQRTQTSIGAENHSDGLLNILFGDSTYDASQREIAESILSSAGLAGSAEDPKGVKLDMFFIMSNFGDTIANDVFNAYYNNSLDYYIADFYGIDLIFNTRDNWLPNALYDTTRERMIGLLHDTYSGLWDQGLDDSLRNKYIHSVLDSNGNWVDTLKISTDNPYLSQVLGQQDPALKAKNSPNYNYYLSGWGCNFMSVIAVPQLITGNVLSADQVNAVWNWAAATRNPNVLIGSGSRGGSVMAPNNLANHVLQNLFGYNSYSLNFTHYSTALPSDNHISSYIAIREQIETASYPTHFFLTDTQSQKVFEPYPGLTRIINLRYDGVFLRINGN